MTEGRVQLTDNDRAADLASVIEERFVADGGLTLFTDGAAQYHTAVKAVTRARHLLASLGIDLAAETFFQDNEGRYSDRHRLKIVLSNKT